MIKNEDTYRKNNFRLLVVDDNEDDRFLLKRALKSSDLPVEIEEAGDGFEALKVMRKNSFDIVFLDYMLPGMNGLEILKEIRSMNFDKPVIMLTGQKDEKTVVSLLREGATDYLPKDSLSAETLRLSIENSQRLYQSEKEKYLAERALRVSEASLAEAQKISQIGNWEYNFDTREFFFSLEAYNVLDYNPARFQPSFINFSKKIHPDDRDKFQQGLERLKWDSTYDIHFRILAGGTVRHLHAKGRSYHSNGKIVKIMGTVQDVTILKNALLDTRKAKVRSRATTIVFSVAIFVFLLSEAILDPFIDAFAASLLISLSFKGSIALMLKPVELFLEKMMMSRMF